jgi:hypothetical protein
MSDDPRRTITAAFEVTAWDEHPYDEPADGPTLKRITVRKRFSGALEGESVAELLAAQGEDGRGYVASERVEGVLDGRSGTFVLQHGAIEGDGALRSFGSVVPGSGTGELRGINGDGTFVHDESGATLTLSVGFASGAGDD